MCFNLFTSLALDLELASAVFCRFFPDLAEVLAIHFEYTPPRDIFNDQTGGGGVDSDLLVEACRRDGAAALLVIETKFVEPEFSICGFRKPGRRGKGRPVCPDDIRLDGDCSACLYTQNKGYLYWARTWQRGNIRREALPAKGCPFAGQLWQLWVNHTLAHVEAQRRGTAHALFAVCAPKANGTLLKDGQVLGRFRSYLTNSNTLAFLSVDDLVQAIADAAPAKYQATVEALRKRYCDV
jgi:hypothetical protein